MRKDARCIGRNWLKFFWGLIWFSYTIFSTVIDTVLSHFFWKWAMVDFGGAKPPKVHRIDTLHYKTHRSELKYLKSIMHLSHIDDLLFSIRIFIRRYVLCKIIIRYISAYK